MATRAAVGIPMGLRLAVLVHIPMTLKSNEQKEGTLEPPVREPPSKPVESMLFVTASVMGTTE